jgi:hypothetical protein
LLEVTLRRPERHVADIARSALRESQRMGCLIFLIALPRLELGGQGDLRRCRLNILYRTRGKPEIHRARAVKRRAFSFDRLPRHAVFASKQVLVGDMGVHRDAGGKGGR